MGRPPQTEAEVPSSLTYAGIASCSKKAVTKIYQIAERGLVDKLGTGWVELTG